MEFGPWDDVGSWLTGCVDGPEEPDACADGPASASDWLADPLDFAACEDLIIAACF